MSAAGQWTRQLPKASGYYWYREAADVSLPMKWEIEPQVIEWDHGLQWVKFTGSDIAAGGGLENTIDGEFWSEPLQPPL